ncbi:P-loop containing nucleoside triphosphate hydrolase protein [Rhizophagus clarus]|nr:P-loop containing nucleoside triphosphate hydrolase protein [Rhizophagus clarus]
MAKVRVNNAKSQPVPRESVYDSELYRVLWNWLSGYKFRITSQWHLIHSNGGKNKHSYSDIVIRSPYGQIFVLELLATATEGELNEHYNRVLNYARLLVADESWIVHFTCEDDYNKKPLWPSDDLLKRNLLVAHFCHDIHFKRVDMIVCWWSSKKDNRSTYQHSIRLD